MCCRTRLEKCAVDEEELALVLRVAGFTGLPIQDRVSWRRDISERQFINAHITRVDGLFTVAFALEPSIGGHTQGEHRFAGQAASILFKTAMVLGERGGGTITQMSLMGQCKVEALARYPQELVVYPSGVSLPLADYPEHPLMFENLCSGFRADLAHGVEQLPEMHAATDEPASHSPDDNAHDRRVDE